MEREDAILAALERIERLLARANRGEAVAIMTTERAAARVVANAQKALDDLTAFVSQLAELAPAASNEDAPKTFADKAAELMDCVDQPITPSNSPAPAASPRRAALKLSLLACLGFRRVRLHPQTDGGGVR